MFLLCVYVFNFCIAFLFLSSRLAQNAGLAAPVVTFGALFIWSVVESESHIQKTLLKLIRNPICFLYELSHRRLLEPSELLEGAIWRRLESSGAIWSHMEPSGVIWSCLELSGIIRSLWSHLEPSGTVWSIWTYLKASRACWSFWSHLEPSEDIWSYLEVYGTIWSLLEPSQAIWTHLRVVTGGCHHMLPFGLIQFDSRRLDLIRFVWSRYDLCWFHSIWLDLMCV